MNARRCRVPIALGLLAGLAVAFIPSASAQEAADEPRIYVLGFDGADAELTERYLDEGHLPNLARLREMGSFAPLGTTMPPQTPVSWSSFATGRNPGSNGIFDFLRRDLATYQPDFAMYRIGEKTFLWGENNHFLIALAVLAICLMIGIVFGLILRRPVRALAVGAAVGIVAADAAAFMARDVLPYHMPTVENTRQGRTFWEVAGEAGVPSTIVRVPATYPAEDYDHGHLLSGLGVPDIRGTFGTFSFYTTEPLTGQLDANTEMGGKIIEVSLLNGETDSYIFGPRNRVFDDPPEILPPVRFKVDRSTDPPRITVGVSGQTQTFAEGAWSDWYTIEFSFSPLIKLYGTCRFFFASSEPFGLYMSAINFDPHRPPPIPISVPPAFCRELAETYGPYKTLGWALDTWALNELRIDEATFLEDVYATEGRFAEIMRGLIDRRQDYRLFVQVYELTDRVAHMFWRLLDPEHPAYDADLAAEFGDAVLDSYIYMDGIVGEVMEKLRPGDLLLVCSDHGFHTWHKSVNYNTWLVRNGFMVLTNNTPDPEKKLEDLFGQGEFWPNVDWSRTRAYALGLGDLYINVKGREAQGIVEPGEEYERVRDELIGKLEAFQDPETGDHPVRRVYKREAIYHDYDEDLIPDLLAANNPKYRVSWQTSLGGIPPDLLQVNDRKWSGDHCSLDPEITKGIFFSNVRFRTEDVSILDFFPTILNELGLPVPEDVDGKPLQRSD